MSMVSAPQTADEEKKAHPHAQQERTGTSVSIPPARIPAATAEAELTYGHKQDGATRSAVLDELYGERSRVLDETLTSSRAPGEVAKRERASRYLKDLDRYIDDLEMRERRESKTSRDDLNRLASELLALRDEIVALPPRR